MKHKLLFTVSVLAACAMSSFLGSCAPQSNNTEEQDLTPSEGLEFTLLDDGESYAFTGLGTCTDKDLVIPATYEGKPVTQVGRYLTAADMIAATPEIEEDDNAWYSAHLLYCDMLYLSDVRSVYVPDGVTSIGYEAFGMSYSLESIRLPDTLTYLGAGAFTTCVKLKEITLPDALTKISYFTFFSCVSLEKVTLGPNIEAIGYRTFARCAQLKSINLTDKVTWIDDCSFQYCYSLTELYLGDNLTHIGDNAFENTALTEVHLGDSLTSIGNNAFDNCIRLKTVTIPKNVVDFGTGVFTGCSALEKITWNAEKVTATPIDDLTDCSQAYFSVLINLKELVFGEGVTEIPDYLFYCSNTATALTLPSTLTKIGAYAFYGCNDLSEVTVASGVTVGENTFAETAIVK